MKNKRSNVLLNIILILLVVIVVISAIIKKINPAAIKRLSDETITGEIGGSNLAVNTAETLEKANGDYMADTPETTDDNYYHFDISGYGFQVLSARITKECDFPVMAETDEEVQIEDGRLTGDFSYLFVEVEMMNNFSTEQMVTINNHQLKIMSGTTLMDELDIYMIDKNQDKVGKRDYLHIIMNPGYDEKITFIYIVKDGYLDESNDLILCLDPMGQDRMLFTGQSNDKGYEVELNKNGKAADIVLNNLLDGGKQ